MGELFSDALSVINNAQRLNKGEAVVRKTNNLLKAVIKLLKDNKYIGEYEIIDDKKGGVIKIKLVNKINKIGAIRPRFPCKVEEFEIYEKRYLPAAGFGIILVSTPKGLMTHEEAKQKNLGGTLIAYCY